MSTAAQAAANAANAQHSTGPVSDAGKAASSGNSLKHGLTSAKTVLLAGEDETAYRTMCEGMFERFAPGCTPETELIQFLCDTQWRLQRCGRIEAAILSADVIDFKAVDIMSKHESRLKKQYSKTLEEARALINTRRQHEQARMKDAMTIRRADKVDGCTTNLQEIGFVFSDEQVEAAIQAEDALDLAKKVLARDRFSKRGAYGTVDDEKKQAS